MVISKSWNNKEKIRGGRRGGEGRLQWQRPEKVGCRWAIWVHPIQASSLSRQNHQEWPRDARASGAFPFPLHQHHKGL